MSRYFNQSRQAFQRSSSVGTEKQADLRRALQQVTQASEVAENSPEARLRGCRKLRLPDNSHGPLICSGSEITTVALESYRALRTRLLRAQSSQTLRSVILSSAVGGEGKTLTTANLALCCSRLPDFRVLAIDADLRTRGLTRLLGDPSGPGLSNVLGGQTDYEDAIAVTDHQNFYVMGAGSSSTPASELYSGNRWKELIAWASQTFRLILVDSPPVLPVADFEQIVGACDGVLMVVRAQRTPRELLKKMADRVDQKKVLGVVFNGVASNESSQYASDYYSDAYAAAPSSSTETAPGLSGEVESAQVTR
jgi:capsular exopolysaccharide synthesis family protein